MVGTLEKVFDWIVGGVGAFTVILVRPVQEWNALSLILVTRSGIVILVRPVQPLNVPCPMLVTPSGMVMLVRLMQL